MTHKEIDTGLASRLLQGAKDLVWQSPPALPAAPSAAAAHAPSGPPAAIPAALTAELLALVMNRPTAYSALAEAIAALADIPMDEATRYRAAFALLRKTQQRTVEQVAQAIDLHLGLLEAEQERFALQAHSAEDEQVTARMAQAASLGAEVDDGARQIASLRAATESQVKQIEQELAGKQERARELAHETEQKKQSLARTRQEFAGATEAVRASLAGARAKLHQYLGGEAS
jgi:chromosome segregation ATPase